MMMLRRPYFAKMAMVAASMAAFAAGGHFVATTAIGHQQSKQLEELARIALRRSEVAVDFGAATLDDIAKRGRMNCDSASLQAIRLQSLPAFRRKGHPPGHPGRLGDLLGLFGDARIRQ
jgi:hypothetical protein